MRLSHLFGISPDEASRLEQANVRTLGDLAAIHDLAAASTGTNISPDLLERWRASASARISARRRQHTVLSLVGLVTAILISGIALWSHKKGISPALDRAIDEFNRGNALSDAGKFAEAADAYQKALVIKPDYPEAQYNLCRALWEGALWETSKPEAAIQCYLKLIAKDPSNPSWHNGLGDAYLAAGNLDDAIAEEEKAVALAPTYTYAWHDLAIALDEKYRREQPPNVATLRQLREVLDTLLKLQSTSGAQTLPPANLEQIEQLQKRTLKEMRRLNVQ